MNFSVSCHNAVTANEQGLEQISFTAKLVDTAFKLFQCQVLIKNSCKRY